MKDCSLARRSILDDSETLRAVWDAAADALALSDAEGRVLAVNPAYCALYGFAAEQLVGHRFSLIFPEEVREWAETQYREVFVNGGPSRHESHVRRADGTDLVVESRVTFIERNGVRLAMLSTIRDLTGQRHAGAERDAVLATISHDLQQPLTLIMVQASRLRRIAHNEAVESLTVARDMEMIGSATRRLSSGLIGFLDTARMRDGQPLPLTRTSMDLASLVRDAVRDQQASTPAHRLELETEFDRLMVYADELRLRRVLDNLLSNAVKFSPSGSRVRVRLAQENTIAGRLAVISVADQGLGIPAAELPYIFERFYRGSNVQTSIAGSGLGLAGARHIVQQHGGTIEVTSAEGHGTTATVRLSLADSADPI